MKFFDFGIFKNIFLSFISDINIVVFAKIWQYCLQDIVFSGDNGNIFLLFPTLDKIMNGFGDPLILRNGVTEVMARNTSVWMVNRLNRLIVISDFW